MIGKKLLDLAKSWGTGLIVPLILGVLIGKGDVGKEIFSIIFPDRDSIGGVSFPLAHVPSATKQQPGIELVLVRHSFKPTTKIEFLRRGTMTLSGLFAGIATEHTGTALPLTGGVNGTRFLELEIPEKTLGGTGLILSTNAAQKARYVVTIGDITKDLSDPDDLVVYTKNESRRITLVHCFIAGALIMVALWVPRATPLEHPTQKDLEDQQWV
ncbi:MAG TPA: hypothetical protein VGQ21_20160 [Thermoanaerobaculia bacterium]|jgi:hypothetical protein|nr:hypothetical protein [Thermoanaerobaculia bacterium]